MWGLAAAVSFNPCGVRFDSVKNGWLTARKEVNNEEHGFQSTG